MSGLPYALRKWGGKREPIYDKIYGIGIKCHGGLSHCEFRSLDFPLTTDDGYKNQLYEELKQLLPPGTIIPPNTPKPFSSGSSDHFDYDAILYAPKKIIPTCIADDATRYLQIKVYKNQVIIKHGRNKNLEVLDTILTLTSLFPKLQTHLVNSGHAKTEEEAETIIKEKIAPLARKAAPLARV